MATVEATAAARPEVDLDLAREVVHEAATRLHTSLALDGLCADRASPDPGGAIRARAERVAGETVVRDPEAVAEAYLAVAAVLHL